MSPGVGLGFTAHEVGMALEGSSAYYRTHEAVQLDRLPQVVEQVSRSLGFLPELSVPPLPATHPATVAEKLVALEFLANSRVNLLQFVDDFFLCNPLHSVLTKPVEPTTCSAALGDTSSQEAPNVNAYSR